MFISCSLLNEKIRLTHRACLATNLFTLSRMTRVARVTVKTNRQCHSFPSSPLTDAVLWGYSGKRVSKRDVVETTASVIAATGGEENQQENTASRLFSTLITFAPHWELWSVCCRPVCWITLLNWWFVAYCCWVQGTLVDSLRRRGAQDASDLQQSVFSNSFGLDWKFPWNN